MSCSGSRRTPAADREALAATVAVDPTKANMLEAAPQFDSQGLQTYGTLGHRISWPQPINGAPTAVIDDCQDAKPNRVDEDRHRRQGHGRGPP